MFEVVKVFTELVLAMYIPSLHCSTPPYPVSTSLLISKIDVPCILRKYGTLDKEQFTFISSKSLADSYIIALL